MVRTTESVGRLIADEVLLQSDRKLVFNRNQSDQQPNDQPRQTAAAPLSHNDKAVASVLLTLLDEQIEASAGNPADSNFAAPSSISEEATLAAHRVAAHYAETDAVLRPDVLMPQSAFPQNPDNQQILLAVSSPELRMAVQSAFFTAAVRAQAEAVPASAAKGKRHRLTGPTEPHSLARLALGIVAGAVLVIFVISGLAR